MRGHEWGSVLHCVMAQFSVTKDVESLQATILTIDILRILRCCWVKRSAILLMQLTLSFNSVTIKASAVPVRSCDGSREQSIEWFTSHFSAIRFHRCAKGESNIALTRLSNPVERFCIVLQCKWLLKVEGICYSNAPLTKPLNLAGHWRSKFKHGFVNK